MALSGYEKQKRWREKHRALYNLQQRNRRKNLSVSVPTEPQNPDPVLSAEDHKTRCGEAREGIATAIFSDADSRGGQNFPSAALHLNTPEPEYGYREQKETITWPTIQQQLDYWKLHDHGGNILPSRREANEEQYGD